DGGEAGVAADETESIAEVGAELVETGPAPGSADVLADERRVAEEAAVVRASGIGGLEVEVVAEFAIEVLFLLCAGPGADVPDSFPDAHAGLRYMVDALPSIRLAETGAVRFVTGWPAVITLILHGVHSEESYESPGILTILLASIPATAGVIDFADVRIGSPFGTGLPNITSPRTEARAMV